VRLVTQNMQSPAHTDISNNPAQSGVPAFKLINDELGQVKNLLNEQLAEMLRRYGSLEYARSRAQEFVTKAIESLAALKKSNAKDALIEAAGFIASRAA
jgi:geranylgeranyl pyrophosphate synthase